MRPGDRVTRGNGRTIYRVIGIASSGRVLVQSERSRRFVGPVPAVELHPVK